MVQAFASQMFKGNGVFTSSVIFGRVAMMKTADWSAAELGNSKGVGMRQRI
jgi:hypothetical protein